MIVEIFSNAQDEQELGDGSFYNGYHLLMDNLECLFERIDLPFPEVKVDMFKTREGGYNLMLNHYGAVLRLYPSFKTDEKNNVYKRFDDALSPEKYFTNYFKISHAYLHNSVPPIGLVQFDDFVVQLMIGVKHKVCRHWDRNEQGSEMEKHFGVSDWAESNVGSIGSELVLLDTVLDIDNERYKKFHENNIIEPTIKFSERYEELQQSFYNAWIGKKSFKDFWQEMEQWKQAGELVDGWNNSPLSMQFGSRGNIVKFAASYDEKLQRYLGNSEVSKKPDPPAGNDLDLAYA